MRATTTTRPRLTNRRSSKLDWDSSPSTPGSRWPLFVPKFCLPRCPTELYRLYPQPTTRSVARPCISGVVPRAGVEPARGCPHRFLRPTRLPFRHLGAALIAHLGEARQYHSPVRRLIVTALTCFMLAACVQVGPAGTPAANTTSTPSAISAASGPRFSQPPVSPPTPPSTTIPAFACSDSSGGQTGVANVTDARLSEQSSYDRFLLQFPAPFPPYTVHPQPHPTFPLR